MAPQGRPRSPDIVIAELAEGQHGVVAARQLATRGVNSGALQHRVEMGRLHRLHRGVFAVGHRNVTLRGRLMAAVLACGGDALLSYWTAGALWDLVREGAPIHVTSPGGSRL